MTLYTANLRVVEPKIHLFMSALVMFNEATSIPGDEKELSDCFIFPINGDLFHPMMKVQENYINY